MIQGIILAAGRSSRFGSEKMLHTLANGRPMVIQSAINLLPAVDDLLVVVNPAQLAVLDCVQMNGMRALVSSNSSKGMGHSLADAVQATPDADGWIVALGDMPFLTPQTACRVAQKLVSGRRLVAPVCEGRRGHPVGFEGSMRSELSALSGDVGAQKLLRRHAADLALFPVNDVGSLQDIDYIDDCLRLFTSEQIKSEQVDGTG